jgi:hypothetical protein
VKWLLDRGMAPWDPIYVVKLREEYHHQKNETLKATALCIAEGVVIVPTNTRRHVFEKDQTLVFRDVVIVHLTTGAYFKYYLLDRGSPTELLVGSYLGKTLHYAYWFIDHYALSENGPILLRSSYRKGAIIDADFEKIVKKHYNVAVKANKELLQLCLSQD